MQAPGVLRRDAALRVSFEEEETAPKTMGTMGGVSSPAGRSLPRWSRFVVVLLRFYYYY